MRAGESLTYINGRGEQVVLAARNKPAYWLSSAEGIDGLESEMFSARGAGQDGEILSGTALQARVITVEGRVMPKKGAYLGRRELLRVVNPKLEGRLVYRDEDRGVTRYIACRVQQAPIFSESDRFPVFQFELFCPYPYWRDGDGTTRRVMDIALWVPNFSFDLEFPEEGIEFEYRAPSLIVNVPNLGDAATGMVIEFRALGSLTAPSLVNVQTQETLCLTTEMVAGDMLRVATGYGEKTAVLTRAGNQINVFNDVTVDSDWLQLDVGDNLLRYNAEEGLDNLECTISYAYNYLGV